MALKKNIQVCVCFIFSFLSACCLQSLFASEQISRCVLALSALQIDRPLDGNRMTNLLSTLEASRNALAQQLNAEKEQYDGAQSVYNETALQAMADGIIPLDPRVRQAYLRAVKGPRKDDEAVREVMQRLLTINRLSRSENLSPAQLIETENKVTRVIQESIDSIQAPSTQLTLHETIWRNTGVHAARIKGFLSANTSLPSSSVAMIWSSTNGVPAQEFFRSFSKLSELGFGPQYYGQLKIPMDDGSSLSLDVIEDPSNWTLLNGAGSDFSLVFKELSQTQKEALLKIWRALDRESLYAFEYSIYEDQAGRLRILPTRPHDSRLINREHFIEEWTSFYTGLTF